MISSHWAKHFNIELNLASTVNDDVIDSHPHNAISDQLGFQPHLSKVMQISSEMSPDSDAIPMRLTGNLPV